MAKVVKERLVEIIFDPAQAMIHGQAYTDCVADS